MTAIAGDTLFSILAQSPVPSPTTTPSASTAPDPWMAWLPVVTFLLGQLSVLGLEVVRQRFQKTERADARRLAIEDRRADFQRETLIALSDALIAFNDATFARAWVTDTFTLKEGYDKAYANVFALAARVIDEQLREATAKTLKASKAMLETKNYHPEDDGTSVDDAEYKDFVRLVSDIQTRLGATLRVLY
jgi:hypothetical protein